LLSASYKKKIESPLKETTIFTSIPMFFDLGPFIKNYKTIIFAYNIYSFYMFIK
jgi:hypothetical protein